MVKQTAGCRCRSDTLIERTGFWFLCLPTGGANFRPWSGGGAALSAYAAGLSYAELGGVIASLPPGAWYWCGTVKVKFPRRGPDHVEDGALFSAACPRPHLPILFGPITGGTMSTIARLAKLKTLAETKNRKGRLGPMTEAGADGPKSSDRLARRGGADEPTTGNQLYSCVSWAAWIGSQAQA